MIRLSLRQAAVALASVLLAVSALPAAAQDAIPNPRGANWQALTTKPEPGRVPPSFPLTAYRAMVG